MTTEIFTLTLDDVLAAVKQRQTHALTRYRSLVTENLAGQHRVQLLQRSLLMTVEQIYAHTLRDLENAGLADQSTTPAVDGRAALTPQVLAAFQGFSARLLGQALTFNAGSCALSNFPTEQKPDDDYLQDILRDLAAAWRDFALEVNRLLLGTQGR